MFEIDIQIINPITYPGWDELVASNENYSFFHSSAWARVLAESYGYTPLYFVEFRDKGISALLPFMEVKTIFTGLRGVSLPFSDHCSPIIDGDVSFAEIFNFVLEYGKNKGWKTLELRGGQGHLNREPSEVYIGHRLSLGKGQESVFKALRDSTKRNIKKAKAEGVEVRISDQLESIKQFYDLNSVTRKRHGLPPQPFSFFKNVLELVIKKGHGIVVLAFYENKAIAGSVFFHFGKKAIFKYGASDLRYQNLRANNLVMWEAIRYYSENGFENLSLGRTETDNQGLLQFKSGWGTTEQEINYYHYDFGKQEFISARSKVTGFHNKIFSRMPIPLLRAVGSIFYKHVG